MRLSGSVKLRCAFGSGAAAGGGLRGGFSSTFARGGCSAAALAFASASNSALAWRILASRACLSATQSGISSPRRSAPNALSAALVALCRRQFLVLMDAPPAQRLHDIRMGLVKERQRHDHE